MKIKGKTLFISILMLFSSYSIAGDLVGKDEIVSKLTPKIQLRGFAKKSSTAEKAPSINFNITFEFNSFNLTEQAKKQLDELAFAMGSSQLLSFAFQINGHTDAVGGDQFNLELSQKRANAVKEYLQQKHGISSSRLEAMGWGKRKLIDPAKPDSDVNRRVEIITLVGSSK